MYKTYFFCFQLLKITNDGFQTLIICQALYTKWKKILYEIAPIFILFGKTKKNIVNLSTRLIETIHFDQKQLK